jgi:hypothetical protein
VLHRTNDSFRATNPDDEFLGPEPEDEDELPPEPTVEEVWDGRGEYIHEVTFASGRKFYVMKTHAGPFVGDYEIVGPSHPKYPSVGFYADGYLDPQEAIDWLCDPERRDW